MKKGIDYVNWHGCMPHSDSCECVWITRMKALYYHFTGCSFLILSLLASEDEDEDLFDLF